MVSPFDELGRPYSAAALQRGLQHREKVVYSLNGNRATSARAFLRRIERVCSLVGIRRVGDISFLSASPYPVFQSVRPNLFLHAEYGQSSGAQGKGNTPTQARISCIMEAIEGYCAEPRHAQLVRASYRFLAPQHLVLDPRKIVTLRGVEPPSVDEPIMWTPAYSVRAGAEALVPAQLVYSPFINQPYRTRSIFVSASNGLASGSTYLEAAIHALYELIERYYVHKMEAGEVRLEALFEHQVAGASMQRYLRRLGDDDELQLYSLTLKGIRNLPMIMCCLIERGSLYIGWGCSGTVDISISRAFSEALQSQAARISGAREDLHASAPVSGAVITEAEIFGRTAQPDERTLSLKALRARVHDRRFVTLAEEYAFILAWLTALGFDNVFFANLTRQGIDVPVVKALIPDLEMPAKFKARGTTPHQPQTHVERQFRNMLAS